MSDRNETGILDRNLALEVVRVTEAAALSASKWMGRGRSRFYAYSSECNGYRRNCCYRGRRKR